MIPQHHNSADRQAMPSSIDDVEAPVKAFFDQYADYYERSWDLREHSLSVGMFENYVEADAEPGQDLEDAYQRSREHVINLLQRVSPLGAGSRALDVCCGTGATLSQITDRYACLGLGVDISSAQIRHAKRLRNQCGERSRGQLAFKEGSASLIRAVAGDTAPFTHIFSQEGLLFAHDKRGAMQGICDLLEVGGALVISDFVPQLSKQELDASLRARVYEDVKWAAGLSFEQYLALIKQSGFEVVQAELRPVDMRMTYQELVPRTEALAAAGDETYAFLARRYSGIVRAVDDGALSWGWFAARKR